MLFERLLGPKMLTRNAARLGTHINGRSKCLAGVTTQLCRKQSTAAAQSNDQDVSMLQSAKPFHELPSPLILPVIGNAWVFLPVVGRYSTLKQHIATRHKRKLYGNVWREKLGPLNIAVSFQAEDMETVFRNEGPYPARGEFTCIKAYRESRKQWYQSAGLLILEGKEWQDLRRKTQKHLMKPKAIAAYVGAMQDVAHDFVQRMDQIKNSKGEVDDFLHELYKWSLESVAYVGLDTRLGTFQSEDSDGLKLIKSVQTQFELMNNLEGFLGNIQWWKLFRTPKWKKFEKASDEFSEIAFKYIKQACDKLKTLDRSGDQELTLLQAMLAEEGLELEGALVTVADMLFGGIDTTSHTAGFFLYQLAQNPDKQEMLHQEITDVLAASGGRLSTALLPQLTYLRACLKETLRMHPIISVGARILDHDVVISGYRVPSKTAIIIMLQEMCMDTRYYKDPTQYLPERWLNRIDKPHPFSYLPFGSGPRSCIGRRLAELEVTSLIVEIIKRYKVEYKYEDIDILTKFVNTPDKPLRFNFVERN